MATAAERPAKADESDVEEALALLLAMHSAVSCPLSEWEQHCLESAMIFERHGYYDKALARVRDALDPPVPLPPFSKPPQITLDDIRRHVSQRRGRAPLSVPTDC